jgi:hypothetical protein
MGADEGIDLICMKILSNIDVKQNRDMSVNSRSEIAN